MAKSSLASSTTRDARSRDLAEESNTTTAPRQRRSLPRSSTASAPSYASIDDSEDDVEFHDERATKRRKLAIRDGSKQGTLDGFLSARPPVRIAQTQPDGQLVEQINGVRHELSMTVDDLNGHDDRSSKKPKHEQQKQEEKRTLRSQDDGPRLKSELETYFSNYEDVIFDTLAEPELLNVDSILYITDTAVPKQKTPSPAKARSSPKTNRHGSPARSPPNRQVLDLTSVSNFISDTGEDPLADEVFMKAHKRAERKEKQMRNIEREHAMHEKVQLERLLDGLLGHDWLKVLGITGVTETEGKKFEPKRQYFIAEVRALVKKFEEYREEEKRQKERKEAALAAQKALHDDESEASSMQAPSTELNESASRQLQQESASALKVSRKLKQPVPYVPPTPLTSFFSSRHLRDSALKKNRNSRNQAAFGLPIPEPEEREFELPDEILTEDVLRDNARERRRRIRETVANAAARPP